MTCNDCIHYDACMNLYRIFSNDNTDYTFTKACSRFKDKSRYIEPPCAVGDRLFCIFTDRGITETYNHIEVCRVTEIMYFGSDSFVVGVREINRHYSHNVVLDKDAFNIFEEAEQALLRKEDEGK